MEEKVENAEDVIVLIAEDDEGHASLIIKNLNRASAMSNFLHFKDGQEVLDFLFMGGKGPHREPGKAYLLLLDIRMPKVDGVEVLSQIKEDPVLSKIPVIMLTTTDDQKEIEKCHKLGCNTYVTKPVDYYNFTDAMKKLGFFLSTVRVPRING